MNKMLRLSKSIVGTLEKEAVSRVLDVGYLGMGAEVGRFEDELKSYLGTDRPVVCVNTGTSALHLAVQAVAGSGDEVLVPSLTFLASFQAIKATGANPIACDVNLESSLIDLEDAARRVTPRTKAIMPVHYASEVHHWDDVYRFAKRFGLRVIEDAAHAFGCSHGGTKIGAKGDIVCFSFDGIKNITSGEGGAIVSGDPKVVQAVADARLLGIERDSEKRYQGKRSWDFEVRAQGWRYHMSDMMAAIGRVQLTRFEQEFKPKRQALCRQYRKLLSRVEGTQMLKTTGENVVAHIFPIRVLNEKRDAAKVGLEAKNIPTGMHYKPNHLLEYFGGGEISLPNTEKLYAEMLTLPLHPELTEPDIEEIVAILKESLQ